MTQNGRDLGTKFTTLRPDYFFSLSLSPSSLFPFTLDRPSVIIIQDRGEVPAWKLDIRATIPRRVSAKTFSVEGVFDRKWGEGDPASLPPHSPEIMILSIISLYRIYIYVYWKEEKKKRNSEARKFSFLSILQSQQEFISIWVSRRIFV